MVCILKSCHYVLFILFSSQMENLHVSVQTTPKSPLSAEANQNSNTNLRVLEQNLCLIFVWNTSLWYLKLRNISMWLLSKSNKKLLPWLQKYYSHSTFKPHFFCQCGNWWQMYSSLHTSFMISQLTGLSFKHTYLKMSPAMVSLAIISMLIFEK